MGKQRPALAALSAVVGLAACYRLHLRPWLYTWGARADEVAATLPGDELVHTAGPRTTRAVSVDASSADIWPWLAQIGEDRGGFYSYSLLERAVGADVHNADAIHPEWQHVHVGDTIWLARRYGPAARQMVAAVQRHSHLVLMSPADFERVRRGQKASGSWAFVLRQEIGATRLLARGNGGAAGHFWFDIPHFVMEQKMLRGIARRAGSGTGSVTHIPAPAGAIVPCRR
ncbi:hypothetical protein [Mycolicibacterium frederiksbergense]|uniref:hypothetical protein n=1 Tax=Mycolicibacterium frederiksbergense TaxID=117567 RepID=UPI00265C5665|nr:hypothetical protein [Mycolicibacterium frederiksbergense]MDO0972670.1 hypothetical protein [Mycolicibacterium frederiksbergense]